MPLYLVRSIPFQWKNLSYMFFAHWNILKYVRHEIAKTKIKTQTSFKRNNKCLLSNSKARLMTWKPDLAINTIYLMIVIIYCVFVNLIEWCCFFSHSNQMTNDWNYIYTLKRKNCIFIKIEYGKINWMV